MVLENPVNGPIFQSLICWVNSKWIGQDEDYNVESDEDFDDQVSLWQDLGDHLQFHLTVGYVCNGAVNHL